MSKQSIYTNLHCYSFHKATCISRYQNGGTLLQQEITELMVMTAETLKTC